MEALELNPKQHQRALFYGRVNMEKIMSIFERQHHQAIAKGLLSVRNRPENTDNDIYIIEVTIDALALIFQEDNLKFNRSMFLKVSGAEIFK